MSTQNVQSANQFRSSGHKEPTADHTTRAALKSQGEGGDTEALLQNRLLDNHLVSRAALYDVQDFLCVGSSTRRFQIEPDDVRKIYDGVLTAGRQNDPTVANQGEAPKTLGLGKEGRVEVGKYDQDHVVGEINGKPFIAAPTSKHLVLVEGMDGANVSSLETLVQSFQSGLSSLTL